MKRLSRTRICIDTRFDFLKIHLGIRIRPLRNDWLWNFYEKGSKSHYFGPIEITLFCGYCAHWFGISTSLDLQNDSDLTSFRIHPFIWRRESELIIKPWIRSVSIWFGPFWIYCNFFDKDDLIKMKRFIRKKIKKKVMRGYQYAFSLPESWCSSTWRHRTDTIWRNSRYIKMEIFTRLSDAKKQFIGAKKVSITIEWET